MGAPWTWYGSTPAHVCGSWQPRPTPWGKRTGNAPGSYICKRINSSQDILKGVNVRECLTRLSRRCEEDSRCAFLLKNWPFFHWDLTTLESEWELKNCFADIDNESLFLTNIPSSFERGNIVRTRHGTQRWKESTFVGAFPWWFRKTLARMNSKKCVFSSGKLDWHLTSIHSIYLLQMYHVDRSMYMYGKPPMTFVDPSRL